MRHLLLRAAFIQLLLIAVSSGQEINQRSEYRRHLSLFDTPSSAPNLAPGAEPREAPGPEGNATADSPGSPANNLTGKTDRLTPSSVSPNAGNTSRSSSPSVSYDAPRQTPRAYPPPSRAYPPPSRAYPPPSRAYPPPSRAYSPPPVAYSPPPMSPSPPPAPLAAFPPPFDNSSFVLSSGAPAMAPPVPINGSPTSSEGHKLSPAVITVVSLAAFTVVCGAVASAIHLSRKKRRGGSPNSLKWTRPSKRRSSGSAKNKPPLEPSLLGQKWESSNDEVGGPKVQVQHFLPCLNLPSQVPSKHSRANPAEEGEVTEARLELQPFHRPSEHGGLGVSEEEETLQLASSQDTAQSRMNSPLSGGMSGCIVSSSPDHVPPEAQPMDLDAAKDIHTEFDARPESQGDPWVEPMEVENNKTEEFESWQDTSEAMDVESSDSFECTSSKYNSARALHRDKGSATASSGSLRRVSSIAGLGGRGSEGNSSSQFSTQTSSAEPEIDPSEISICREEDGTPCKLGQGAFGSVYRATRGGVTEVAVKVLHDYKSVDVKAFQQEAAVLASCRDPNICQFLGACFQPGSVMIVMEYCARGDLKAKLSSVKEGEAYQYKNKGRQLMLDVAAGLAYLHSKRVIHFDLKSSNVMLVDGDRAKIGDVGLASVLSNGEYVSQLEHNGTFTYAAPELILGGKCGPAADMYSFGVLLHEICTGESPKRGQLRSLRVPEEVPSKQVEDLMIACLEADPQKRPSAKQAHNSMKRIQ